MNHAVSGPSLSGTLSEIHYMATVRPRTPCGARVNAAENTAQ